MALTCGPMHTTGCGMMNWGAKVRNEILLLSKKFDIPHCVGSHVDSTLTHAHCMCNAHALRMHIDIPVCQTHLSNSL